LSGKLYAKGVKMQVGNEYLKAVETDGGWRTTYICPYTDKRWLLDYTKIADQDQSQYARLRPLPPKPEQH